MILYRGQRAAAWPTARMPEQLRRALDASPRREAVAASGRWFTDDIESARRHARSDGRVVAIDVSDHLAEAFRISNLEGPLCDGLDPRPHSRDPEHDFLLPAHIAARAGPMEEANATHDHT